MSRIKKIILLALSILIFIVVLAALGHMIYRENHYSNNRQDNGNQLTIKCSELREEKYIKDIIVEAKWGNCQECFRKEFSSQYYFIGNEYIYILDTYLMKLNKYNKNGVFLKSVQLKLPDTYSNGLGITEENDIYVLNGPFIFVFDADGKPLYNYILPYRTVRASHPWFKLHEDLKKRKSTIILDLPQNIKTDDWMPFKFVNCNELFLRINAHDEKMEAVSIYYELDPRSHQKYIFNLKECLPFISGNLKVNYCYKDIDHTILVKKYSKEKIASEEKIALPGCFNVENVGINVSYHIIGIDEIDNIYLATTFDKLKNESKLLKMSATASFTLINPEVQYYKNDAKYSIDEEIEIDNNGQIYKMETDDASFRIVRWEAQK